MYVIKGETFYIKDFNLIDYEIVVTDNIDEAYTFNNVFEANAVINWFGLEKNNQIIKKEIWK